MLVNRISIKLEKLCLGQLGKFKYETDLDIDFLLTFLHMITGWGWVYSFSQVMPAVALEMKHHDTSNLFSNSSEKVHKASMAKC